MPKKLTDREIEELYDRGDLRLSQERNDFLLPQVLDFVQTKKWLNLHPEYQRRLVWDSKKRSLFIESLLMNLPIPPVFLFEWDYNRYEVMDGQQRLSAVTDFYENLYKLKGLERWSDLNGRRYNDLPPKIKRGLDRRRISAVVLLAENLSFEERQYDVRRMVFERLNTGGQNLNAQEIRNCLFSSPFNDMIVELAGDSLFDDIWEIPRYKDHIRGNHISAELSNNRLYKRMEDCEIVLRFFAFRKKSNIRGSVKRMLDKCMEDHMNSSADEVEELKEVFLSRLKLCQDIFGNDAFRLYDSDGKSRLSKPLYDAVMITSDRLFEIKDDLIRNKEKIAEKLNEEMQSEENYELIVARANTADAIKQRIDKIEEIYKGSI